MALPRFEFGTRDDFLAPAEWEIWEGGDSVNLTVDKLVYLRLRTTQFRGYFFRCQKLIHAMAPQDESICRQFGRCARLSIDHYRVYGASNRMSLFTRTLNRCPTGILMVGCTLRFRRVMSVPSWLTS